MFFDGRKGSQKLIEFFVDLGAERISPEFTFVRGFPAGHDIVGIDAVSGNFD